ncbi:MAG: alpha/beta hydrolase [Rhodospirillales bacterium]|nr:alpha/beta hydrolase [Rhodospirillales bacterium]MDH3919071.1 alpha/beta hydrolase [Rhodospirillales bacterium]
MSLGGIWSFLLFVLGVYLALGLLLFLTQSRLLYYPNLPSRAVVATPARIGLAYEEVALAAEDGVRLHGWFLPAEERARGVLLFFHGNAGNISHRLDSLKIFHDLGLSVLIFDYRGYGQSEGKVSEAGTYRDAEAAWRHLTEARRVPEDKIVLFGRSLGAAVAAHLATRQSPKALIMESSFTSVPDLAAKYYRIFPVHWLSRFRYDARADLGAVVCPVLIVHSRDDEIIPVSHGRALFEAAPEPKAFLELSGGHNDGFLVSGRTYTDGLDAFLAKHLDEQAP